MAGKDQQDSLFLTLDGIRGLAAGAVVVIHNILFWGLASDAPAIPFAVDVFLVISGFVIAFAYEPRFKEGMSAVGFMRQRFVRLYPLYLVGIIAGGLVLAIASLGDVRQMTSLVVSAFPAFLMLPSPPMNAWGDLYPLDVPAWTLFFELAVNLIYVLLWKRLTVPLLALLVVAGGVALVAMTLASGHLDMGPNWTSVGGGLARAVFGFFMGVLLYRLVGSPRAAPRKHSWLALPALVVVPVLSFLPDVHIARPIVELAFVCLVGPALALWGVSMQPPRATARLIAWIGAISYALYVLHYPLYQVMKRVAGRFPAIYETYAPWSGIAILIASIGVAALAAHVLDKPMRKWLNARLTRKAPAAPIPTP